MKTKHRYDINFMDKTVHVLADDLQRINDNQADEWLILLNDGDEVFRTRTRYLVGWSREIEKRDFA
ncbi:hypothetical protein LCGC14_3124810 [marine sediment metagenome]|uniref:Uncharacterized protein n=1 Tax=marine sediment metagenome TaxID=412755 RepID=A0A0F8Y8P4_9ZZZZ